MKDKTDANEKPKDNRSIWRKLMELEGSPHAIAGGLAVGMFFGISPLWGLKTLLTLGTSALLRVNPIAAVISLSAHDLLTPFVPVVLRMQYDIGYFLLSHPHHLPPKLEIGSFHPQSMMHWTTFVTDGVPLLVGAMVVAIPSTIATYFGAMFLLRLREKRKAAKSQSPGGGRTSV